MFSLSKVNQNQIKADFRYDLNNNVTLMLVISSRDWRVRQGETRREEQPCCEFLSFRDRQLANDMMEEKNWTAPQQNTRTWLVVDS